MYINELGNATRVKKIQPLENPRGNDLQQFENIKPRPTTRPIGRFVYRRGGCVFFRGWGWGFRPRRDFHKTKLHQALGTRPKPKETCMNSWQKKRVEQANKNGATQRGANSREG